MASGQAGALVHRTVDGMLVGWLAVGVWLVAWAAPHLGLSTGALGLPVVYWIGAVATAAHFGLSYHLAYRGGLPAVRRRPVALLAGPVLVAGVLAVVTVLALAGGSVAPTAGALITSVYLMTTWHYVKQVYGVGRVGAAFAGVRLGAREAGVLRYGLYPMWLLGAARILVTGNHFGLAGYHVGYALLPPATITALRWAALASVVPIAVVFVRIARRGAARPPSLLVAPYAAAVLWLAVPTSPVLTIALLAPFHALQYLAVGHRAAVSVTTDRSVGWWLNVFGGAAAGGLLVSRWAPALLDAHVAAGGPLLFTAAAFVFLNLHHYLIDASIWRSKGELVRAVVRGPVPGVRPAASPQVLSPAST